MTKGKRQLSRRHFLRLMAVGLGGLAVGGGAATYYGAAIEPFWLEITERHLTLPRLSPAFEGYRLVQISDIHADEQMTAERLRAIFAEVNTLRPDAIAITGDFVSQLPIQAPIADLRATLPTLRATDGVVAVLGNHDHWTSRSSVRQLLTDTGIQNVSNTVYTVRRGAEELHLCGVDDVWERFARLGDVLNKLPAQSGAAVLLAHEPDYADTVVTANRFDLQLSGHSHGGQVVLPGGRRPVLPHLGQKYPAGWYQVGSLQVYTNRGVGMVAPKIRLNCRPEITLFVLHPPNP